MTARKTQGWDEFWAEVSGGRTEVIRGVEVTVPTDVPLIVEKRFDDLRDSDAEDDIAELISMLFGVDALDAWRDGGMGLRELQTVLTWGMAHATGREITFREALDIVQRAEEGKAPGPNRATRRAAPRSRSASTGARSKPTSPASTGSGRKTSRT